MSLNALASPRGEPERPSAKAGAPAFRPGLLLVALVCATLGLWLAAHHPLSAPAAVIGFVLACAALTRWPLVWPSLLPALLPWMALAPWSGWISFEELDLLVLAVAAAGYARWAWRPLPRPRGPHDAAGRMGQGLLLLLWTASVAVALQRGVVDAGGWHFDWFEAYRGPMNALRLAKPTLALLLLLALWRRLQDMPGGRADERLTLGLALGHGAAALSCLWERAVFPGVLNFSTDYRTTGPFWEMHVGGAALDGWLALTFPFALHWWWQARRRSQWLLGGAIVLLGVYAVLSTFSRILLLAVPLGVGLMLVLRQLQLRRQAGDPGHAAAVTAASEPAGQATSAWWSGLLLWGGVVVAALVVFPTSGYRGMLALLGNASVLLVVGPRLAAMPWRQGMAALAIALAAGPALWALASLHDKGAYLVYVLVWAVAALAATADSRPGSGQGLWRPVALAALWLGLASTAQVAQHWGGPPALQSALWAVAALVAASVLCLRRSPRPWWPVALRWQAAQLLAMAVAMLLIGMASGGAYLSERMSTANQDQQGRVVHWQGMLAQLPNESARWLGQGLGRFLEAYAFSADAGHRPGDLRLVQGSDGQASVQMVAGDHVQGWGEILRLSQRISRPQGLAKAVLVLSNDQATTLHAEVCIKHLLYDALCQLASVQVAPSGGRLQTVEIMLAGPALPADPWYARRHTVFSVATESAQAPISLRRVALLDADGSDLLANGNFAQGGARWFFSSDRNHMPWHAKNMVVHLLFEQGRLGLAAMLLLSAAAGWALMLGRARGHAMAPALAGALAGFWVVGMIDSLLDLPRIATLFLLLTAVALTLPTPPPRSAGV